MSNNDQDKPPRVSGEEKPRVCAIDSKGVTCYGHTVSWVIIVVVLLLIFIVYKRDMIFGMYSATTTARPVLYEAAPAPAATMVGGMSMPPVNFAASNPSGDVARMFKHNK